MPFGQISHSVPQINALFQLTGGRLTKQHIIDYSPSDPGYPDYVRLWAEILKSRSIPKKCDFDLSEVIGLTGWSRDESVGFQSYRRFMSAVGLALIASGNHSEEVRPANYLARDLLVDVHVDDREHFNAVKAVFPVMREHLIQVGEEEDYPFFTLGSLILGCIEEDTACVPKLAQQLLDDDQAVGTNESLNWHVWSSDLVLGLTGYTQLHMEWNQLTSVLINPVQDENMQLIVETFADMRGRQKPRKNRS